ncbi:MAG: hypothetical protein JSV95_06805 [Gemmatimonadota bacterium]|jgi:hypothetical protein|nr:MAG: hypothetical protein JSV95_06805 [Gemmatimonadota bacterium]
MSRALRRFRSKAFVHVPWTLALVAAFSGCDVQWGGARLALENPAPPAPEPATDQAESPPAPLPDPPLLYLARLQPDGRGFVTAIAGIQVDSLTALRPPRPITDEYRQRFERSFLASGRELALVAGGRRIGGLVIEEPHSPRPDCLPAARVRAILPPGTAMPDVGFGVPLELAPDRLGEPAAGDATSRMVTFGPVLAEQLLRADGVARPYLAQRVALEAVSGQDTLPEMAATYMINDSLAVGPPRGREAASLFFIARRDPTRGYVAVWRELRTYGSVETKEAFTWVGWLELSGSRFDFVQRYGGSVEHLVASRAPDAWRDLLTLSEREFEWSESPDCPALLLLAQALSD